MKTELLMSVVMIGGMVVGAADVQAACTTTPNCESMGYKYCESECPSGSVACPFDSSKRFCFSPKPYTITAESCAAECKNVGTKSCTKGGMTYYESCGASTCSSGQICDNGTCRSPAPTSGLCCGYTNYCGYSGGTSNSYDSSCRSYYGISCYNECKSYGYPDCTDMHASCRASGGSPVFQRCYGPDDRFCSHRAKFSCE